MPRNAPASGILAVALLLAAACSSTISNPAPDPATVPLGGEGIAFAPVEVVMFDDTNANSSEDVTRILASTNPGICSRLTDDGYRFTANEILLSVRFVARAEVGTAALNPEGDPSAALSEAFDFCGGRGVTPNMGTGTVTISRIGAGAEGVLDVKFGTAQIRGRFTATQCPRAFTKGQATCR
jgi:hypothetical protein